MRPIRVGVFISAAIGVGGGYQQSLNAGLIAHEIQDETIEIVFFTACEQNIHALSQYGMDVNYIILSRFEDELIEANIDLVYFVSPNTLPVGLEKLNYITTVWDLCHRDEPAFPEVRWNRELESREGMYHGALRRAVATIADSELGRQRISKRYGIDEEKVHVIPFQPAASVYDYQNSPPSSQLDIREKYSLKVPYVFYPAQFWAHKNHIYLLDGLKVLEEQYGVFLGAIFSGTDMGNMEHVISYAEELGLSGRVRFAGFVDNEEVPQLYSQSIALVMPTYFGPTNLPPLEAFALGIPVLYSDLDGLREQVGDAGLLMDLLEPSSMAEHVISLIQDPQLRERLIEAGYERLKYYNSFDRVGVLHSIIKRFQRQRMCWA